MDDQELLEELKEKADSLGITYHPSIGASRLQEKIDAFLLEQDAAAPKPEPEPEPEPEPVVAAAPAPAPQETEAQRIKRLKKEATKLVRVRITCMNPYKSEWDGEIFTVSNRIVPTQKRFVPYNVEWHVPQIMLEMIEARMCQVFITKRDPRTGNQTRKGQLVKEFAVEVLPPLSPAQIKDLAQRQAMANGTAEA